MVSYPNETKVKDMAYPSIEYEVKELLKAAMFDFAADMKKDVFEHTIKRLTYLISSKYKALTLGEVKYIFESMTEFIKGKLSVSTIMQLFYKYMDEKIEKQRREMDEMDLDYDSNIHNCLNSPLGKAIIHKINMLENGELLKENWEKVPLKKIAEDIQSGKILFNWRPDKKIKHIWD